MALDKALRDANVSRLDVLKIDIEGSELAALRGARDSLQRFKPVVIIELAERALTSQGASSAEVIEFLRSMSYRLYEYSDSGDLQELEERISVDGTNAIALPPERLDEVMTAAKRE